MTPEETDKLPLGLYRIHWKSDPHKPSLAAVGNTARGSRWIAPCNWIMLTTASWNLEHTWNDVERVELIEPCT